MPALQVGRGAHHRNSPGLEEKIHHNTTPGEPELWQFGADLATFGRKARFSVLKASPLID
jgi:hypothetical protein